jgi:hypothetical protein
MQTVTANIYHQWLNSALIQAGSGALHDHFCKQGLWVSSTEDGDLFKIYGDDRLLTAGAGDGVAYAAETAQLSQDNIAETLAGGQPQAAELKLTRILNRFPAYVVPDFETPGDVYNAKEFGLDKFNPPNSAPLRLDDWHDELKGYMDGKYLKSLFSTWTHHYAASIGGTLTTYDTVSPHTGEEF